MSPLKSCLHALLATGCFASVAAQPAEPQRDSPLEVEAVFEDRAPSKVVWKGDLAEMRARRLIRVLVPNNRTFFFYDGLQPRGLAYEFMNEFVNKLNAGKSTNDRVYALFLPSARDRFVPDIANGYGDVAIAGLTATASREKQVDFIPYDLTMNEIVVTAANVPALKTIEDLSGRKVFVRRSSSYYESLTALNARLKAANKPPVQIKLADEHLEDEEILELVHAGAVPITVVDAYIAKLWAPVLPAIRVHPDLITRQDAHMGPIVRNDNPELKKALASFMKTHGPGTAFGNVVIQRYTRDNPWVRNPGTTDDLRRFKEALPFFQKYAKQYDFDYMLIAAQAYQESRINQKLKSPMGAVGVMQIKPTTASDPNVGIPNVHAMDTNIHAGVKYLRFISDRYFSDAHFDELNRHVFAFAAYNAGPARIQSLRTAAAKQGLDPNEWFNNVEIVAGRKIGREPVDYVRNILKYWVAYHFALDSDEDAKPPAASEARKQIADARSPIERLAPGPIESLDLQIPVP
jgi:membrane-bound lytic murein transglycosylase MltF